MCLEYSSLGLITNTKKNNHFHIHVIIVYYSIKKKNIWCKQSDTLKNLVCLFGFFFTEIDFSSPDFVLFF